ncbi:MAG: YbhB/YbcL family Raf kinase inhibitor-like protein [Verrucomicrobia bacterium]|nr:YbhB/YbcL family Raf kinase inhibitor-like protein [Verrucomicrobiota bacterium]MDE3047113.1 YbhB/YbcL family Raf kinase inhibitor-like protein [Verrucomicrobiota bacterium]
MKLTSSAFQEGGIIPSVYTCEGKNCNPPLTISGVPPHAQALVLIMDDPDVPKTLRPDGMYDHWVVINMPPETKNIVEARKPPGMEGKNTGGQNQYVGPCPPDREHRYFFKLYALDQKLSLRAGCTKKEVEQAMEGHILAKCQLMGRYEKGKGY